jgi:membrane protein
MKSSVQLVKQTLKDFAEDKALRLSAALAYYSIFSLAPLLIIVISVTGAVFGDEAVQGHIATELKGIIGPSGAETVQSMVESARKPGENVFMSLVGLGTLLLGASGVFGQLKDALNTVWEISAKPGRGLLGFLNDRFLSFSMVLGIAFLLLISLVISAALQGLGGYLESILPLPAFVWTAIHFVSSLAVITLLFAMMFKVLPDATVAWRDVWIGAACTAILFTVGKFLLGMYLGRESTASAYGAAGSVVIVLLWIYYSSVILLLGAEFTQVYAQARGSRIAPGKYGVALSEGDRARQGIPRRETVEKTPVCR